MEQAEILEKVDKEGLKHWLSHVGMPVLVEPSFFVYMGFEQCFVRQFLRKHRKVLLPNGTVQRGVRGVSEVDFLWGLADSIGADTTEARRISSGWKRTRSCAEACLRVLERIDGEEQIARRLSESEVKTIVGQEISKVWQ